MTMPAVLSPDSRMVAFTAEDEEGVTRLYLRHLDKSESVSLPGTEDAAYPFWSPDGRYLACVSAMDTGVGRVLDWLDEHTGPGEKVQFAAPSTENLLLMRRWGTLPVEFRAPAPGR